MDQRGTVDLPDRVERDVVLPAPVEEVGAALTDSEHLAQWFSPEARVDARPGGEARFGDGDVEMHGVVEEVDPPHRFSFRWDSGAVVEFTLEEVTGGTRLTLVEWRPYDDASVEPPVAQVWAGV